MAAVPLGVWLLCCGFIHGHKLSGVPARSLALVLMLQGVPAVATQGSTASGQTCVTSPTIWLPKRENKISSQPTSSWVGMLEELSGHYNKTGNIYPIEGRGASLSLKSI